MEPEVQASRQKKKKTNVVLVLFIIFILLMLLSAAVFAYLTLQNKNIYKGVHIESFDVSGMSKQEVFRLLETEYRIPSENEEIILKAGNVELKATFPELGVKYDIEAASANAYAVGHTGNIFERLYDVVRAGIKGVRVEVPQSFDENKISDLVNRFYLKTFASVKEGSVLISDDKVIIKSGHSGTSIDKAMTVDLVKNMIYARKGGVIEPEINVTRPTKLNAEEIYNQIVSEPADATYVMENSRLTLVPHVNGRRIDKEKLKEIIAELEQTEDTERELPVFIEKPAITTEMAASMLFRDVLASYSTSFSTNTQNGKNRKHNMGLAVNKINNLILMPGEEFSFNNVVGPRNAENGYKAAHVYVGGRIEDGIGGGICQVSTTLYNAVLLADLKVTERRNHSFTVGYVPLGQDATAFYGGTDFRFVNSTKWPIKLLSKVEGNKIYFSIVGTKDNPGKSVIISNKILSRTPHKVVEIKDPTLPVGTKKERQEGLDGYVVETYKTVKVNGKVVSQVKLHTSRYNPCTQELLVGTKPVKGIVPALPGSTDTSPGSITIPGDAGTLPGETTKPESAGTPPGGNAAPGGTNMTSGGTNVPDSDNITPNGNNVPGGADTIR